MHGPVTTWSDHTSRSVAVIWSTHSSRRGVNNIRDKITVNEADACACGSHNSRWPRIRASRLGAVPTDPETLRRRPRFIRCRVRGQQSSCQILAMAECQSSCSAAASVCQNDLSGMTEDSQSSSGVSRDVFDPDDDLATEAQHRLDHAARAASGDPEVKAARVLIQAGGTEPDAEFIPRRRPWLWSS